VHVTAEATLATTSVHLPQKEEGSLDTTATGAAKTKMGNKNIGIRRPTNNCTRSAGRASGSHGTRGWAPTRNQVVWRRWVAHPALGFSTNSPKNLDEQKLISEGARTGSARTGAFHGHSAMPRGKPSAARGAGQEGRPGGSSLNPQLPGPEKRSHSVWFKNISRQWKTAASSAGCRPGPGAPAHRAAHR